MDGSIEREGGLGEDREWEAGEGLGEIIRALKYGEEKPGGMRPTHPLSAILAKGNNRMELGGLGCMIPSKR